VRNANRNSHGHTAGKRDTYPYSHSNGNRDSHCKIHPDTKV
jgi:hypothetical protein